MGYTADGLLTSFTDPRLNSSTFTYDNVGRLTKDQNAAGGFLALSRVDISSSYTVTITTTRSYTNRYNIGNNTLGAELWNNNDPSGLQYQTSKGIGGARTGLPLMVQPKIFLSWLPG